MGTSWGFPQKSSGAGVSSQWAQSDPQAAIAWLASISEQGNSEARDNALGSFIESFSGVLIAELSLWKSTTRIGFSAMEELHEIWVPNGMVTAFVVVGL